MLLKQNKDGVDLKELSSEFKRIVGARIKNLRKELNISSAAELAEMCGIHSVTQYNYERGTRLPDAYYLYNLGKLGFDVNYIVMGVRGGIIK